MEIQGLQAAACSDRASIWTSDPVASTRCDKHSERPFASSLFLRGDKTLELRLTGQRALGTITDQGDLRHDPVHLSPLDKEIEAQEGGFLRSLICCWQSQAQV